MLVLYTAHQRAGKERVLWGWSTESAEREQQTHPMASCKAEHPAGATAQPTRDLLITAALWKAEGELIFVGELPV